MGPFPATGKEWALPICELWHFDADGRVVGGEIYYDQVSLLTQLEPAAGAVPSMSDEVQRAPRTY